MKKSLSIIPAFALLLMLSCNSNKGSDITYEYVEEVPELSAIMREKVGDWAEEGKNCYGLLALINANGDIEEGAVIEARIIRFNGDSIKMRSLESLNLKEVQGCDKMGISRGQTWWETEGEIFETKEAAQASLDSKMDRILE